MNCKYCQISNKKENFIYETNNWRVFLDFNQSYLGRCRIILKRHSGNLSNIKDNEWLDFTNIVKKLESALKKSFDATMFNWTCLINDAYKLNPPNPHIHWHFRPRYNHKVKFAGETFEDTEFASHYDRTREKLVSNEVRNKIIEKIKSAI